MKKIIILLFFSLIIAGCGYKVVEISSLRNFHITEITDTGDKRINFFIKNKLLFNNSEEKERILSLNIDSSKKKTIYEKNDKNEITKHQIDIKIKVKYILIPDQSNGEFIINETRILDVRSRQSSTLSRERRLIDLMCVDLANKIEKEIYLRTK